MSTFKFPGIVPTGEFTFKRTIVFYPSGSIAARQLSTNYSNRNKYAPRVTAEMRQLYRVMNDPITKARQEKQFAKRQHFLGLKK